MRWASTRPHDRRHREGAGPDLGAAGPDGPRRRRTGRARRAAHRGPDVRDEPRGHRAPPGDRRAVGRDHLPADRPPSVAHADRAVRGSRRPALAGRAHPGPLRAAARGRARDLLRADPPHRGRRDRPAPVRAGRAAAHPRPAGHGVVAGRAAARLGARGGAARDDGPPRGGRIVVDRRRARAAGASWRACSTATSGCRSATSRSSGSRAGARRSPAIFDVPEFLPLPRAPAAGRPWRTPRAPRPASPARRTWSSRSTTSPGWRRGWACGSAAPLAPVEPRAKAAASARLRPGEKPPLHRGLAARLVARLVVGGGRRDPAAGLVAAARDHAARGAARGAARLGAARRRHRRGRERPRPHLGGRRAGDGPHVQGAAPHRRRPAGRGDRDGRARSGDRSARSAWPPRWSGTARP